MGRGAYGAGTRSVHATASSSASIDHARTHSIVRGARATDQERLV
jgi:hypothetical protein